MLIGHVGFLFLFTSVLSSNHIFLEHPMSVLLPIGRTAQITCRTNREYGIQWIFLLQNPKATIITDIDGSEVILRKNGIRVEGLSTPMSVVTIQSGLPDDQIKLTCQAVQRQKRLSSNIATVTYFGPPSPVTNLTAIEVALATLRIVWSTDDIRTDVVLNFTLTVISLKSQQMIEQLFGTDQEYLVTAANRPLCDLYSFEVLAVNAAGTSKPSSIEHRFPSIPNITLLEQSLQQTLVKTEEGVTLTVKFRSDISCPDYPVLNYTLVLQEPDRRSLTFFEARRVTRDTVTVTAHLDANAHFQYSIIAANRVGNTGESTPISIITTTVQSVFVCQVMNTSYFIQCTYLNGSTIRGCIYALTSRLLGVENVTGMININNTQGAPVDPDIFAFFDTLLAIEWPFDHQISAKERPIHVVGPSLSQSAPACTHEVPESSDFVLSAGIAIAIIFSFILIVATLIASFLGIHKSACHKKAEDKELPVIDNIKNQKMIKNVMKTAADMLQNQQNTFQSAVDSILQNQSMEQIANTVVQQPKKKLEDLVNTINKAITKDSEVFYDASEKIDSRPAHNRKVQPENIRKDNKEVRKERDQSVKKEKEQPAKREKEQPARREKEQPARREKEQPARREKEQPARREKEQPARREKEQPARREKEQPARREKEQPARREKEQPARRQKEQPAKKEKEQSVRPAIKQFNKDDTKREIRSREKGPPHGTSLFPKHAHKNVKRVYSDDGTSGEVYPDYSNRGETYPDRGSYRNEEYKQSGGPSSQDVYYDAWDGRHTPRGKEGKVYKSVSDHRGNRTIRDNKRLKQKTYSSRNCRVEVFDDFATEVSLPSKDRTDKILSDLKERARHKKRVEAPIDLDDFATDISLPTNDISEKILEDLEKRALQIRRDRELKKANRQKVSIKKVKSYENRLYIKPF